MQTFLRHITFFLNSLFGGPIREVCRVLHLPLTHPNSPIDIRVTCELCVTLALLVCFVVVRVNLSVEQPGILQHIFEMFHEYVSEQAQSIIGDRYTGHLPFLASLLLFIVPCNLIGMIPGVESPTQSVSVPLGLALITFVYSEVLSIRNRGPIGYLKHLAGPIWWASPLIFPVEVISHLNRNVSLTVRLYANMYASDLLTLVFFSLIPIAVPIVFLGLHLVVSIFQGYVFMLLATLYIAEGEAINGH